MPANPKVLSGLSAYIADKIGGNPPTGGDKDKGKGATPVAKPGDPIPMFDPNDPKSRQAYVDTAVKKHNLPHGYGDVFTRFNEIPATQTDTLNTRQLINQTGDASGLPKPLFYSSAMVEGMSGLYPQKGEAQWSGNEKFPVDGFVNFGLDNFSDAYPRLVKGKYLDPSFNNQFVKATSKNEKGQSVNSANFTTAKAALQAKAAMIREAQDQVNAYAAKNKIPLTDKARQFLTLAAYNGGPGAAQTMLQEANKSGGLANDAYFQSKPAQSKYGQVWDNVNQRFQLANAITAEKYKFEDPAPPPQQPPIVTSK